MVCYYMCLATHAFHCSLCVSLFMSTQSPCATWGLCSPKVNPKERTCLPPNLTSNLEHIIWEYVIGVLLHFALHVNYFIGKYWFLSLKNMIIINLSFWTCHKKFIRFLNMFTIWIISFETCSISLSVILALGMQKIFFGCNNNHIGFLFSICISMVFFLFLFFLLCPFFHWITCFASLIFFHYYELEKICVWIVYKNFHLFELENLCVNCTKEKKNLVHWFHPQIWWN